MIKFKWLSILLIILIHPCQTYSSTIGRNLTEYDYKDIKEFSRACEIAYGKNILLESFFEKDSPYLTQMQDNHWDISYLLTNISPMPYGIKAVNGPLTVISYAGTNLVYNIPTFIADIQITRAECGYYFPSFQGAGILHRGIAKFYANLKDYRTTALLKDCDPDEKVVITGHSLGGALAVCGALDLINNQRHQSENYPPHFCSIMTLGCPAFLDTSLRNSLNQTFTGSSHLRFFFNQDPISNLTRGPQGFPFSFQNAYSELGAFVHGGLGILLEDKGFLSHSCTGYISEIERHPVVLQALWPLTNK